MRGGALLNGIQVNSMINVASQVSSNEISYESGLNILKTAFNLPESEAVKILGTKTENETTEKYNQGETAKL